MENETAPELMTLVELQKFLADELADATDGSADFSRAFLPLTDGLGLENPTRRDMPTQKPVTQRVPASQPFDEGSIPRSAPAQSFLEAKKTERAPVTNSHQLDSLFDRPQTPKVTQATKVYEELIPSTTPPPVPQPSIVRRGLAAVVDLFFVLTLFLFALAITSVALGGSADGFLGRLPKEFANHEFLRYAILEYTTLWLVYFLVSVGVTDATVGMWAWGMRVSTGNAGEGLMLKRVLRSIFSFLFYAPILPLLLLTVGVKGRNLIDILSGTHVYRSAV